MIPIKDVEKALPAEALEIFKSTFSPSMYNELLLAFRMQRTTTFRVNLLKADKNQLVKKMQDSGLKAKKFDMMDNAYLYEGRPNDLLKSSFVTEGLIYLQSLSSMIPPLMLDAREGERILDIASAPGSKTTQLAAITKNNSVIDAVEPDFIRMERLKYNANLLGAKVNFFQMTFQDFAKVEKGPYDRILADLPCSGEGRFSMHDKPSYVKWRKNNVPRLARLQKDILHKAVPLLKTGGIIVYSTCTLNYFENEEVIDDLLKDPGFKIEIQDIDFKYKDIKESIRPVLNIDGKSFNKAIAKCLRIMPSSRFEGFFICRMKRR